MAVTLLCIFMILSCWNVHGVFSCLSELSDVMEFSDIVFISEHWLPKHCLPILNTSLTKNYGCFAKPGITKNNITRGGIAFLFRKSSEISAREVKLVNERVIGIEIGYETNKLFIIGCLLPSTNLPLEEYKQVMQDVFDLFNELSEIGPVILCGDFNTAIKNKCSSPKSKLLMETTHERNLSSLFSYDTHFTFQTKDKIFRSLLDFIFVPEWIIPEVKYKEIFQDFAYDVSDHFPLLCEIDVQNIFTHLPPDYSRNIPKWKLADTNNLAAYRITCGNLLNSTDMVLSS